MIITNTGSPAGESLLPKVEVIHIVCQVTTSRRLAWEEAQVPTAPGQTSQSAGSRSRAAQISNSKANNKSSEHNITLTPKSQAMRAGQGKDAEGSQATNTLAKTGAQLETGRGRSCGKCTLQHTDL